MAVTASGLFVPNWLKMFNASQLAFAPLADTMKIAMFTNSVTPNFSSDTAYNVAPYNANEASGTGYTAGGATLSSFTVTESPTGTVMFAAGNPSWASSSFTARAGLIYDATVAGVTNAAIALLTLGADYTTVSGTFTVTWAATGMWAVKVT